MIFPAIYTGADVVPSEWSSADVLRVPLALVSAAGVGLAVAGVAEGSLPLLVAGAAVWLASGYAWERASKTYTSG